MTLVVRSVRRASVVTRTTPAPQALYEPAGTSAAQLGVHAAANDPHGDRAFAVAAISTATTAVLDQVVAGYQPKSAQLSALAGIAGAEFGRGLIALPSAAALRAAAELGTAALASAAAFDPAGAATAAQAHALQRGNHTGTQPWATLTDTPTTLAGYGITEAVSSVASRTGAVILTSADLADSTAVGRSLLTAADAPAQRTALGLGSIATQAANAVAITGGTINSTPIGAAGAAAINGTVIAATTSIAAGTSQLTQGFLRFNATGEPNTYIRRPNNDQLSFVCGNVQVLLLRSGGVTVGELASNAELLHLKGDSRRMALESYGGFAHLRLLSAGGTMAAALASASGANLGQISAAGMRSDGNNNDFRATGYLRWTATQAWATTACGTRATLSSTPNNAVDPVDRLHIDHDGAVLIGTATNDGTNRLQVNGSISIASGNALKVNNVQVVAARDTGWGALSGTTDKATAYATYAGQNHGGLYSMAAMQALDDAVRGLSRRHGALEAAARTHGLIN